MLHKKRYLGITMALLPLLFLLFGYVNIPHVSKAPSFLASSPSFVEGHSPIPESADARLIREVIERGWWLRIEAGLEHNRGEEHLFEEEMRKYFSDKPKPPTSRFQWQNEGRLSIPPAPIGKTVSFANEVSPLTHLAPTASEWEIQKAYIANGRHNQKMAHFWVDECGVQQFDYKSIEISNDQAKVIVDIIWWCKISHEENGRVITTKPVGGEQHAYILQKENEGWKIVEDIFMIIPGYEP